MIPRPTTIILNLGPIGPDQTGRIVHHYRDAKTCADAWARAVAALEEPSKSGRRIPATKGREKTPPATTPDQTES